MIIEGEHRGEIEDRLLKTGYKRKSHVNRKGTATRVEPTWPLLDTAFPSGERASHIRAGDKELLLLCLTPQSRLMGGRRL